MMQSRLAKLRGNRINVDDDLTKRLGANPPNGEAYRRGQLREALDLGRNYAKWKALGKVPNGSETFEAMDRNTPIPGGEVWGENGASQKHQEGLAEDGILPRVPLFKTGTPKKKI